MYILQKVVKIIFTFCVMIVITSCGSDSLVGKLDLTLEKPTQDDNQPSYSASFTAVYTHPKEVLPGTVLTITETLYDNNSGLTIWSVVEDHKLSSLGGTSVSFTGGRVGIQQLSGVAQGYIVKAQVGDIVSQKIVTIPALNPLVVSPNIVSFTATDANASVKTVAISGGVPTYLATTSNGAVAVSISGATLTITRNDGGAGGSCVVTVSDQQGSLQNINVNLTAIP